MKIIKKMMTIICITSIFVICLTPSVRAIRMPSGKQYSEILKNAVGDLNQELDYIYKGIFSLLDCVNKSKNNAKCVQHEQKLTNIEKDLNKIRDVIFKLRNDKIILEDENFVKYILNESKVIREKVDGLNKQTIQLSETIKLNLNYQENLKLLYGLCEKITEVRTNVLEVENKIDDANKTNNIKLADDGDNIDKQKESSSTNINQLKNNKDLIQKIDDIYMHNKDVSENIEEAVINLIEKHQFSDERQRALEVLKVIDKYKYTGDMRSKIIEQFVVPVLREKLKKSYEMCCNDCSKKLSDKLKLIIGSEDIDNVLEDVVNIESNNLDDMIVYVLYSPSGFFSKTQEIKEKFYRRYSCLNDNIYSPVVLDIVEIKWLTFRLENVAIYNLGSDKIGKINKKFINLFNRTDGGLVAGMFGYFTGITYEEMINELSEENKIDHSLLNELHDCFQEVIDDVVFNVNDLDDKEVREKLLQDFKNLNLTIDKLHDKYIISSLSENNQTMDQETKEQLKACMKKFMKRVLKYLKWRCNVHDPGNSINNWRNVNGDYGAVGVSDFSVRVYQMKIKRYFMQNFSSLDNVKAHEFIKLSNEAMKRMDSFCEFHNKYIELQPMFSKYLKNCLSCDNNLKITWIKLWQSYGKQTIFFDCSKVKGFVMLADKFIDCIYKKELYNTLILKNFKLENSATNE